MSTSIARSGLKSVPNRLGIPLALRCAALCHALMIVALVGLGLSYPLGRDLLCRRRRGAALLVYEHALVRPDDLTRVNLPSSTSTSSSAWVCLVCTALADLHGLGCSSPVDDSFSSD